MSSTGSNHINLLGCNGNFDIKIGMKRERGAGRERESWVGCIIQCLNYMM